MTWTLIKHYSKTAITILFIVGVVIISIVLAGKNKKILQLLKDLKIKKVQDDTAITEQKIKVNEDKITTLKADSNASAADIKNLEDQNAAAKAKIEENKNSIDALSKEFDSLIN